MYRILIAEDDAAMRTMLDASLTRAGFEVLTAADGRELLALLEEMRAEDRLPNLIISDISMPGMSGLDVLVRLQRMKLELPIILITAFGDARTHRRARALGAVEVIDKPLDLRFLCTRVAEIVEAG